jgi:methanogenic corrinoid protein MtbC1
MDVGRLLALGYKASELLRQGPEDLRERVGNVESGSFEALEYWISLVERFDAKGLMIALKSEAEGMGLVELLDTRLSPFLWEIGERWSRNELRISHEHFATIRLSQFLGDISEKSSELKPGVKVLLATLPGDLHGLGLSMADAVLRQESVETVVLGADNPVKEIASTAKSVGATHIAISISRGSAQKGVGKLLDELMELVPGHELLLGGGGVSLGIRLPRDVRQFRTMGDFQRWSRSFK